MVSWHRKSPKTIMQILQAQCPWLKHEWSMTTSVRLMRQLTSQDVPVKQGRALSLPLVGAWEGSLFLYEYHVEECSAGPLVAVIANSCKFLLSSPRPLSPPVQPSYSKRAEHVQQDWAALTSSFFFFCYVDRKFAVWCNWCSLLERVEPNRKPTNETFSEVLGRL